jgi:hypothetical protein
MTGQSADDTTAVNRRYVAMLAGIAVILLLGGLFTRSWLAPTETPSTVPPPSQATAMQQLSMEGQMRRTATFVVERVAATAPSVTYVAASRASGVRWNRDTVLAADSATIVRALVEPARFALDRSGESRPQPERATALDL